MSHGQHRTPKPRKNRRLRTLAAALGLAAAATTGITLATDVTVTTPTDTGWGAPDTTTVIATDNAGTTAGAQVSVQPFDTGWG